MNTTLFPIHVRTMTGLEKVLARELKELGAKDTQIQNRVVLCHGDLAFLYRANLWSRVAIRVLRPIHSFPAKDEKAFYEGVRSIAWKPWVKATGTLAVHADVFSSFTTHSLFIAQLTKDAIADQFLESEAVRPSVDLESPDLRIVVSLFQNNVTVFLDSSGESLHRRGYRRRTGEAPLRETLAAGILKLAEWDTTKPLLDPMCGSGTFCIEAGWMAKNVAPGLLRDSFGFQKWADFDSALYAQEKQKARDAQRRDVSISITGLEIDPGVAAIARENVEAAGLSDLVRIATADFFTRAKATEQSGTIVINPPYDERLAVDNIAALYEKIGDTLRTHYESWSAFLLTGNLEAARQIPLKTARTWDLFNGSIECRLFHYPLTPDAQPTERARWRKAPQENAQWKERGEAFSNRLRKNLKHLSKWAKRDGLKCWRLYDWDIPELPFLVDIYGDRLHFAEVPRNHDHSPSEHESYLQLMVRIAGEVAGIPPEKIYFKTRAPRKTGGSSFSPHGDRGEFFEVEEAGHRFLVNLSDYLDVGLPLEHRKTRAWIGKQAQGKDFLNLYAYTGAFTVYAAAGGARSTTTVDTASTYLDWAQENMTLNGFAGSSHCFERCDSMHFLATTAKKFDLIVVDPPNRSMNRSTGETFDIQFNHPELLLAARERLKPGGTIYFITSARNFRLDEPRLTAASGLQIREITAQTTPEDFSAKSLHRIWQLNATH